MKYCFALLLCFTLVQPLLSQTIGSWKSHLPYRSTYHVQQSNEEVFAATEWSLFSVNKTDNSISFFDKTTGLSDIGIAQIGYHSALETLVIAYNNGNVDLLQGTPGNREINNIPYIHTSQFAFDKTINHIDFHGEKCYFSTNFGVVVLRLDALEIEATYILGDTGQQVPVYGITANSDSLFAATSQGVKSIPLDNPFPEFFGNWQQHGSAQNLPEAPATAIIHAHNRIWAVVSDTLFQFNGTLWVPFLSDPDWKIVDLSQSNDSLIVTQHDNNALLEGRLAIVPSNLSISFITSELVQPTQAVADEAATLWISDPYRGLIHPIVLTPTVRIMPM
jgi:hypothetical protein